MLRQRGARPSWIEVGWRGSRDRGDALTGWVKRSQLVHVPPWPRALTLGSHRYPFPKCPEHNYTWAYRGRATIAKGTRVLSSPAGREWATVADDHEIEVTLAEPSAAWITISYATGLGQEEDPSRPNPDVTVTDKTRIDGAVFRYVPAPRQHAAAAPTR